MRLRWRWAIWLLIVAVCAAGLRHYRVDNGIDEWMPDLKSADGGSFLVIGGFTSAAEADEMAEALSEDAAVSGCLSPGLAQAMGLDPTDLVLSRDGRYAGVICFASAGVDEETFHRAVLDRLGERRSELAMAGPAVFREAVNRASQQRLDLIMALIAVLGTVLTWATVGSFRLALMSVAALLSAQIALLGAISWLGRPIDMTLSMVPPLMMALGFSYAAHHLLRRGAGVSLVLCGLTTLLGIGSFAFTSVPPVRHFAIAGMAGLLITWLAVMALLPAAGAMREPHPGLDHAWQGWTRRALSLVDRRARWIIALALLATVAGTVSGRWVRIETNPLRYFPGDSRIVHDYDQLNDRLTGMLPSVVEVSPPEVAVDVDANPGADPGAGAMLRSTAGVRHVLNLGDLSDSQRGRYLVMADQGALPSLAAAQSEWQAWALRHHASLRWTGVAAQLHEMGRLVLLAAISTLPVMMVVITVVLAWITRSVRLTLAGLAVNVAPLGAVLLAAAALDWPMGLPTLMIGAITVGVAVDDTVHLAMAWRQQADWRAVLRDNFRACAGSSIIAACCLALFGLSPFVPTSQFGIMLGLAIAAALVGDLVVFAAVLRLTRPGTGPLPMDRADGGQPG